MPGTEVELAFPKIEVVKAPPLEVAAAPVETPVDQGMATLAKTPENRKQLICKDLLQGGTLVQARAEAEKIYLEMLENSQRLMLYGTDAMADVNNLVERILHDIEPTRIPELNGFMKELNANMLSAKRKYDVTDPKVAEKYEEWASGVRKWFRKGVDFVTMMKADIIEIEKQLDKISAELTGRQVDMTRNVALFDVLYEENEKEIGKLIYVIGVMELIVEVATKDLESIQVGDTDLGDRGQEKRQERVDLITQMQVKIGEYKGRLFIAWATSPQVRMMRALDVGMASKLNELVNGTIPTMKLILAQWRLMAQTMDAATLSAEVQKTANKWTQEFFRNSAVTLPAIAEVIQNPTLTPETIAVVTDSLAQAADGILVAFENGEAKRKELNIAMNTAQGQLADTHQKIDDTVINLVVDSVAEEAPQIATSVPATPALTT